MSLELRLAALARRVAAQFKATTPAASISAAVSAASGQWVLTDGTIAKWGVVPAGATDVPFKFPQEFPTVCWGVVLTPQPGGALYETAAAGSVTKAGFTPRVRALLNLLPGTSPCFYVAFGK